LAVAHQLSDERAEQQRLLEKAVATLKQVVPGGKATPALRYDLGRGLGALGFLHYEMGRMSPAEGLLLEATGLFGKLAEENPEVVRYKAFLGHSWGRLGGVRQARARTALAVAAFRQ